MGRNENDREIHGLPADVNRVRGNNDGRAIVKRGYRTDLNGDHRESKGFL